MQLLSSTNQLIAFGNNANSIIESQLLQLIGSSIIDCPSLITDLKASEEQVLTQTNILSNPVFVLETMQSVENLTIYQNDIISNSLSFLGSDTS